MRRTLAFLLTACAVSTVSASYSPIADWLKLPAVRPQLGNMHGDIAVSFKGEVYVSVQDPAAPLQVYREDVTFIRSLAVAPADLHGFVIAMLPHGEFMYVVSLRRQTVIKMT